MSSVNPIKFLNRGPDYLRTAFQPNKNQKPQLSAAERLNIQRVRKKEEVLILTDLNRVLVVTDTFQQQKSNSPTPNRPATTRVRPATAPVKPRSEFEVCYTI